MSSQEVLDYRIGFEVEGFIKLKRPVPNFRSKYPKEYPNEHFANLVVSTFNNSLSQGQRQLAIRWEKEPGHKPNDKWIVTEDVSLNNKETEKGCKCPYTL